MHILECNLKSHQLYRLFHYPISLGKYVSSEMVARRVAKSGDGSHPLASVWGYGDVDIHKDDLIELDQM